MSKATERDEFVAQLTRALPTIPAHHVAHAARLLIRHAVTHGRVAEAECNGPGDWVNRVPYPEAGKIYERHAKQCERKTEQAEKRIAVICATLLGGAVVPDFQGDPRGYTVKLHLPTGAANTMGGREAGWGVPQ